MCSTTLTFRFDVFAKEIESPLEKHKSIQMSSYECYLTSQ